MIQTSLGRICTGIYMAHDEIQLWPLLNSLETSGFHKMEGII
jgi:hypothetical protein